MSDEYTADQARADQRTADLHRVCQLLWGLFCERTPALRHHPVGRHARPAP